MSSAMSVASAEARDPQSGNFGIPSKRGQVFDHELIYFSYYRDFLFTYFTAEARSTQRRKGLAVNIGWRLLKSIIIRIS